MMSTTSIALSATKTHGINHATAFRPNVLFAPSRRHSRKPECSYELVEEVSYGPRLELYAREKRDGWSVWGDEVESDLSLLGWPPDGGEKDERGHSN
jgi:N6-adenosine-specific RNA methylase IME4